MRAIFFHAISRRSPITHLGTMYLRLAFRMLRPYSASHELNQFDFFGADTRTPFNRHVAQSSLRNCCAFCRTSCPVNRARDVPMPQLLSPDVRSRARTWLQITTRKDRPAPKSTCEGAPAASRLHALIRLPKRKVLNPNPRNWFRLLWRPQLRC